MEEEMWKEVEGYNGAYKVSSLGRVESFSSRARILRPAFGTKGYLQVCLQVGNFKKTHKIHRLVSDAFLEKLQPGMSVNHKNNIKTDNRASNLEIISIQENSRKAWKDGLNTGVVKYNKEHPIPKKLTWEQVCEIRAAPPRMNKMLGEKYHVHRMTIGEIRRGEIWKKAPPENYEYKFQTKGS